MRTDPYPGSSDPLTEQRFRALFTEEPLSTVEPERDGIYFDPVSKTLRVKVGKKIYVFVPAPE